MSTYCHLKFDIQAFIVVMSSRAARLGKVSVGTPGVIKGPGEPAKSQINKASTASRFVGVRETRKHWGGWQAEKAVHSRN